MSMPNSTNSTDINITGKIESVGNEEALNAEAAYLNARRKRKRRAALFLPAVILMELCIGTGLLILIQDKDLQNRFNRERQIQKTGEIVFEAGKYK